MRGSRQTKPLREPISANLFPLFMENAGNNAKYKKDLKRAQFRVAYTILYYTVLRLNEIKILTQDDIQKAIDARPFNIVHFKTKQSHIHIRGNQAVKDLKKLEPDYQIIFQKHHYKYLFGKNKPSHEKQMIRSINLDLKNTCERFNILYNIKSHSFRINMISSLLKITSV
jgi:integrase